MAAIALQGFADFTVVVAQLQHVVDFERVVQHQPQAELLVAIGLQIDAGLDAQRILFIDVYHHDAGAGNGAGADLETCTDRLDPLQGFQRILQLSQIQQVSPKAEGRVEPPSRQAAVRVYDRLDSAENNIDLDRAVADILLSQVRTGGDVPALDIAV